MVESVGQKSTNGAPASSPADSSLKRAITRYPLLAVFCATNAKNCSGTRSQSDYGIWHFALVNILMCHYGRGSRKMGNKIDGTSPRSDLPTAGTEFQFAVVP